MTEVLYALLGAMMLYVLWTRLKGALSSKNVQTAYSEVLGVEEHVADGNLRITFDVPTESHGPSGRTHVHLCIFDAAGQEVPGMVISQDYAPGKHDVAFELTGMAAGRYSYRFESPGHRVERWFTRA